MHAVMSREPGACEAACCMLHRSSAWGAWGSRLHAWGCTLPTHACMAGPARTHAADLPSCVAWHGMCRLQPGRLVSVRVRMVGTVGGIGSKWGSRQHADNSRPQHLISRCKRDSQGA